MTTTLSVEKSTIEKARQYAREHNKSLSELVENYLEYLTEEKEQSANEIDPEVVELSDNIPVEMLPDIDEGKYKYLKEKYFNA